MHNEKETASGATNTESGQTKETKPSLLTEEEKVKFAKVNGAFPDAPKPDSAQPLDIRTEMFMLNVLHNSMDAEFLKPEIKCAVLERTISRCAEANGL